MPLALPPVAGALHCGVAGKGEKNVD